jgi:hypothetical protein
MSQYEVARQSSCGVGLLLTSAICEVESTRRAAVQTTWNFDGRCDFEEMVLEYTSITTRTAPIISQTLFALCVQELSFPMIVYIAAFLLTIRVSGAT